MAGTLTLALQHASVVRTFSVRPAISRITFNQVNEPKVTVVIKSRIPPHAGAANYLHGGSGHGAGGEVRVFQLHIQLYAFSNLKCFCIYRSVHFLQLRPVRARIPCRNYACGISRVVFGTSRYPDITFIITVFQWIAVPFRLPRRAYTSAGYSIFPDSTNENFKYLLVLNLVGRAAYTISCVCDTHTAVVRTP